MEHLISGVFTYDENNKIFINSAEKVIAIENISFKNVYDLLSNFEEYTLTKSSHLVRVPCSLCDITINNDTHYYNTSTGMRMHNECMITIKRIIKRKPIATIQLTNKNKRFNDTLSVYGYSSDRIITQTVSLWLGYVKLLNNCSIYESIYHISLQNTASSDTTEDIVCDRCDYEFADGEQMYRVIDGDYCANCVADLRTFVKLITDKYALIYKLVARGDLVSDLGRTIIHTIIGIYGKVLRC